MLICQNRNYCHLMVVAMCHNERERGAGPLLTIIIKQRIPSQTNILEVLIEAVPQPAVLVPYILLGISKRSNENAILGSLPEMQESRRRRKKASSDRLSPVRQLACGSTAYCSYIHTEVQYSSIAWHGMRVCTLTMILQQIISLFIY